MSMNLSVECPHCGAPVNQLCYENCPANGVYIKQLYDLTTKKLGLKLDGMTLVPKGSRNGYISQRLRHPERCT